MTTISQCTVPDYPHPGMLHCRPYFLRKIETCRKRARDVVSLVAVQSDADGH